MARFHGVEVLFESISPPSVRTVDASTIFVIGTAPSADVDGAFGDGAATPAPRYNYPFLLTQRTDAGSDDLGDMGTLPAALDSIFAQGNFKVVMVIVEAGAALPAKAEYAFDVETYQTALSGKSWTVDTTARTLSFMSLVAADVTAIAAIRVGDEITVEPSGGGTVIQTWTVESVDTAANVVTLVGPVAIAGLTAGTNYDLMIEASPALDATAATRVNATGVAADLTGIHAAHQGQSVVGAIPRLLCAPGVDTGSRPGGAANPLAAAMLTVADQLRAMALIDGPNTNHADVITYIGDFDSDRAIVLDPAALIADADGNIVEQALSGFAAGVIARNDYDNGWWASPSNKSIRGLVGLARAIDSGHANSRAQLMLDNAIWTVVRDAGGFQLWGTDTPAATDPEYSFPNVRRTADIMGESIQKAHRWAVAEGITKNYLSAVSQSVNDFIRSLVTRGALTGGLCYQDAALNTPANIALGIAYFNIEWTPVYPANSVVFRMQLTTKYLESVSA